MSWRRILWFGLIGCGPQVPPAGGVEESGGTMFGEASTAGETTGETPTTGIGGASTSEVSTTGEAPSICIAPEVEGIPVSGAEVVCAPEEVVDGGISLEYTDWPQIVLDECGAGSLTVEVPCVVQTIAAEDPTATLSLVCTEEGVEHPLAVVLTGRGLWFAICENDVVQLRYHVVEYGCPIGGGRSTMTLHDPVSGQLLAGTWRGDADPAEWFAPLTFDPMQGGCMSMGDDCFSYQRAAIGVADGQVTPVLVYDQTLRVVELTSRYVVRAADVVFEQWGEGCGEGGQIGPIDVVLAEP